MFALHETTQRRVCRVLFLALCVVPTLVVGAWVAYWHRPWREADWQRTFRQQFHTRVTLGEVSQPRPGVASIADLRLADLRSGNLLAGISELRYYRENSRLVLQTDKIEIQAEQLPELVAGLATWLATSERESLDFRADELVIVGAELQSVEFEGLLISGDADSAEQQRFRLQAANSSGEVVRLVLEADGQAIRSKLDTRKAALPSWLVGKLVPGIESCGTADFLGQITTQSEGPHVRGNLSGRLVGVDMKAWLDSENVHQLQGLADVELQQLVWRDHQLEAARGKITASDGAMTASLLASAVQLFGLSVTQKWARLEEPHTRGSTELIPFEQLAVNFQISQAGIHVTGSGLQGEFITGEDELLAYAPQRERALPMATLLQLFHFAEQGWVPSTRSSLNMARDLPLPGDDRGSEPAIQR